MLTISLSIYTLLVGYPGFHIKDSYFPVIDPAITVHNFHHVIIIDLYIRKFVSLFLDILILGIL